SSIHAPSPAGGLPQARGSAWQARSGSDEPADAPLGRLVARVPRLLSADPPARSSDSVVAREWGARPRRDRGAADGRASERPAAPDAGDVAQRRRTVLRRA